MKELLNRKEAAEYLVNKGLRSSAMTLARLAMSETGPKYALVGRTTYYKPEWLDDWLDDKLQAHAGAFDHMEAQDG
jgi:hypothetical protein